jgi:aspartate-semialdehyde dehydrogenase
MLNVAIVGATGAVGQELIAVLERRRFPIASLRPLASERSAGALLNFNGRHWPVGVAGPDSFTGIDIAFFSAGATRSRDLIPHARAAGALVIDNSSAFRMDESVPLVVPEVNPHDLQHHSGLIANPNCVAAILTVAIAPLRQLGQVTRLIVATYQSASGAGARAMEDLLVQTRASLAEEPVIPVVLPHPYAFNLFSHDSTVEDNGYNGEENKVMAETRKILGDASLNMTITCVRVPILRAHTEVVSLTFDRPIEVAAARAVLEGAAGVTVVDEPKHNHFPMPNEATGQDNILVGRLRQDSSDPHGLNLMICGDQLLKGAALNAVQIAETLRSH